MIMRLWLCDTESDTKNNTENEPGSKTERGTDTDSGLNLRNVNCFETEIDTDGETDTYTKTDIENET